MILIILMAASLFLSVYAGVNLPCSSASAALAAFAIYFILGSLSTIIAVFVSVLLGKTDKLVLKKKVGHFVKCRDEDHTYLYSEDDFVLAVPNLEITETHTDTRKPYSYMEIEHYNMGGWRSFLLLPVYEDTLKFILYLPSKDET